MKKNFISRTHGVERMGMHSEKIVADGNFTLISVTHEYRFLDGALENVFRTLRLDLVQRNVFRPDRYDCCLVFLKSRRRDER